MNLCSDLPVRKKLWKKRKLNTKIEKIEMLERIRILTKDLQL